METTVSVFLLGVFVGQWLTVAGLAKVLAKSAQARKK